MAKDNIFNYSLRLNLRNEQHLRVHKVVQDLNPSIHKSINEFMINAIDFYIKSFDENNLTNEAVKREQNKTSVITKADLEEAKRDIQIEMKDELIRILGTALASGQMIRIPSMVQEVVTEKIEEDSLMADLVSKWG